MAAHTRLGRCTGRCSLSMLVKCTVLTSICHAYLGAAACPDSLEVRVINLRPQSCKLEFIALWPPGVNLFRNCPDCCELAAFEDSRCSKSRIVEDIQQPEESNRFEGGPLTFCVPAHRDVRCIRFRENTPPTGTQEDWPVHVERQRAPEEPVKKDKSFAVRFPLSPQDRKTATEVVLFEAVTVKLQERGWEFPMVIFCIGLLVTCLCPCFDGLEPRAMQPGGQSATLPTTIGRTRWRKSFGRSFSDLSERFAASGFEKRSLLEIAMGLLVSVELCVLLLHVFTHTFMDPATMWCTVLIPLLLPLYFVPAVYLDGAAGIGGVTEFSVPQKIFFFLIAAVSTVLRIPALAPNTHDLLNQQWTDCDMDFPESSDAKRRWVFGICSLSLLTVTILDVAMQPAPMPLGETLVTTLTILTSFVGLVFQIISPWFEHNEDAAHQRRKTRKMKRRRRRQEALTSPESGSNRSSNCNAVWDLCQAVSGALCGCGFGAGEQNSKQKRIKKRAWVTALKDGYPVRIRGHQELYLRDDNAGGASAILVEKTAARDSLWVLHKDANGGLTIRSRHGRRLSWSDSGGLCWDDEERCTWTVKKNLFDDKFTISSSSPTRRLKKKDFFSVELHEGEGKASPEHLWSFEGVDEVLPQHCKAPQKSLLQSGSTFMTDDDGALRCQKHVTFPSSKHWQLQVLSGTDGSKVNIKSHGDRYLSRQNGGDDILLGPHRTKTAEWIVLNIGQADDDTSDFNQFIIGSKPAQSIEWKFLNIADETELCLEGGMRNHGWKIQAANPETMDNVKDHDRIVYLRSQNNEYLQSRGGDLKMGREADPWELRPVAGSNRAVVHIFDRQQNKFLQANYNRLKFSYQVDSDLGTWSLIDAGLGNFVIKNSCCNKALQGSNGSVVKLGIADCTHVWSILPPKVVRADNLQQHVDKQVNFRSQQNQYLRRQNGVLTMGSLPPSGEYWMLSWVGKENDATKVRIRNHQNLYLRRTINGDLVLTEQPRTGDESVWHLVERDTTFMIESRCHERRALQHFDDSVQLRSNVGDSQYHWTIDLIKGGVGSTTSAPVPLGRNYADNHRDAERLRECYSSDATRAFPQWSLDELKNGYLDRLLGWVVVYFNVHDSEEAVKTLATQREPCRIGLSRHFDEHKLLRYFGYHQGAYNQSTRTKLMPNIAIYCKTPVRRGPDSKEIHVINVTGYALDGPGQPDYEHFCPLDASKWAELVNCMKFIWLYVFECAKSKNMRRVYYGSLNPNQTKQLREPYSEERLHLESFEVVRKMYPNIYICKMEQPVADFIFDHRRDLLDINSSLFVNWWNPWSIVGNGNESDDSLDGHFGRCTAMALLCWPRTNPHITYKAVELSRILIGEHRNPSFSSQVAPPAGGPVKKVDAAGLTVNVGGLSGGAGQNVSLSGNGIQVSLNLGGQSPKTQPNMAPPPPSRPRPVIPASSATVPSASPVAPAQPRSKRRASVTRTVSGRLSRMISPSVEEWHKKDTSSKATASRSRWSIQAMQEEKERRKAKQTKKENKEGKDKKQKEKKEKRALVGDHE
eukprot:TRINITY_DN33429_c0_g1_i1.p1 TRINITY_DN33429_c0_g1~~TRINITY_DN33429_c0_g1_i1.p1  ORF type:complete len:1539 (+),score=244.46 TRINITY_DN33429_c0_g1_i1:31-4647(+)